MAKCFTDFELAQMTECVNLTDDQLAEADCQDREAMRGNAQQMSEADAIAQMADEAAEDDTPAGVIIDPSYSEADPEYALFAAQHDY